MLLLYLGLMSAAAGVLSLLFPLRFLGIRTRKRGLLALGLGFLLFVAGVYLPVSQTRVETARTRLDEFMPVYQFSEFHSIAISASGDQVYRAIWAVRPEEIRFFRIHISVWKNRISSGVTARIAAQTRSLGAAMRMR